MTATASFLTIVALPLVVLTVSLLCADPSHAFMPGGLHQVSSVHARLSEMHAGTGARMGEFTRPEQKIYDLLKDMHDSQYSFRLVLVNQGAILETTSQLGPILHVTQNPSTGANLMTLASKDQAFEFHVRLTEISKMVLTAKTTPTKTLRLARLLNAEGESMCSLILAEQSDEAVEWFEGIIAKYGSEIQL